MPLFVCTFEPDSGNLPTLYANADITNLQGAHGGTWALSLDGIRAFGAPGFPPFLRTSTAVWAITGLLPGHTYALTMFINGDAWQGGLDPTSIVPLEVTLDDGVSGAAIESVTPPGAGFQSWTSSAYTPVGSTLTLTLFTNSPAGQGIGTWVVDDLTLATANIGTADSHMANATGRTFERVPWYTDDVTGQLIPHGRAYRDHWNRLVHYLDVDDFGRDDNSTGYAPPEKDPKEP